MYEEPFQKKNMVSKIGLLSGSNFINSSSYQVVVVFLVCENRQDGGIPGMEAASLDELKKGLEMHW